MNYTPSQRDFIDTALRIIAERAPEERHDLINKPQLAVEMLTLHYATLDQTREHFTVLFMDSQHRRIEMETLFSGTIDGAAVYPRVIAKRALELNAAAVILAHNHPSGTLTPSAADRKITERIREGLALFDIRTLDHLILHHDRSYSFAEHGDI